MTNNNQTERIALEYSWRQGGNNAVESQEVETQTATGCSTDRFPSTGMIQS